MTAAEFVKFASYATDTRPEYHCNKCGEIVRWNVRYILHGAIELHTCEKCGNQLEYSA